MNSEEIISFVRQNGPLLPVEISKKINKPIIIASAMLSELVDSKKLRLSSIKVGGSPLYFAPGHEQKLLGFLKYLNEKDRNTVDLLRREKVLREDEQNPLVRVSLKNIKDFAIPLDVEYQGSRLRFWKWAFISNQEAEPKIRELLHIVAEKPEVKEERPPEKKPIPEKKAHEPKPIKKVERVEEQQQLTMKNLPTDDHFLKKVERYLERNEIEVVSKEIVKKRFEVDLIVRLPSSVGRLTYYCKAKQKKRCTDSDLSSAYVQGEMKKLPVLFLCTGELTKKAKEMSKTAFANMSIMKI